MTKLVKNLITNVQREKLLSLSNIAVMTITFLVLGIFIIVVAVSQTTLRYLEQQAQITLFFKDEFSETRIFELKTRLEQDQRISEVKYISKDDAFKIFSELNKDEPILLESITPSILPASLEVNAKDLSKLPQIADELNSTEGLEELRFFRDVVNKFRFWSSMVYIVGFVLIAAFVLISYTVVIATLRTTINSKGVELEIMKLVGASDGYVKNPLILQGVFFGFVSSLIAGILIMLVGVFAQLNGLLTQGIYFGFLTNISFSPLVFSIILFFLLVLSGLLLGLIGSYTAVKRYLKY
jgi:cell division transport system permease protein